MTEATLPENVNEMIYDLERVKRLISLSYEMYRAMMAQQLAVPLLGRYLKLMYGKKS